MVKERKEPATGLTEDELWALAFKRLVPWAVKRHGLNPADAEEMVQDAIKQFLASGGVADPSNPQALLQALGSRINGLAVNRRRKKAERAFTLTADGEPAEPDDPPDPEQRIVGDDVARRAVSALFERVGNDEVVFWIVTQMSEGVDEPADHAKALGLDVREVYNARRRLKTHVEAIKKLMETW